MSCPRISSPSSLSAMNAFLKIMSAQFVLCLFVCLTDVKVQVLGTGLREDISCSNGNFNNNR